MDGSRKLIELLAYSDEDKIVAALAGVSQDEHARRYRKMMNQQLEEVAPDKLETSADELDKGDADGNR